MLGGKNVTRVHGAVPGVAPLGLVPPEISSDDPAPDPPGSLQVVVSVSTVALLLALIAMYCPVYGLVSAYC